MQATIPGFRIGELLGRGGQGDVWKAIGADGQVVALKVLREDLCRDADVVGRFRREAALSLSLRHPHVLRALAADVDAGRMWLASELADGGSLQQQLKTTGALPIADAVDVMRAVLSGLDAIRGAGLVHRDIKPANLLFVGAGPKRVAKISDLGMARTVSPDRSCYTTTGAIVGTPAYIAPELVLGEAVSIQADLYSTGCLLYACLCGHPPFRGVGVDVLRMHLDSPVPDPRAERPTIPAALAGLVRRLLAKRPGDRPADPAEALSVLDSMGTSPADGHSAPGDVQAPTTIMRPALRPFPLPAPGGTLFPATLADGDGTLEPAPAQAIPPTLFEDSSVIPATLPDQTDAPALETPAGLAAPQRATLRHPAGRLMAYTGAMLRLGRDAPTEGGNDVCLRLPGDAAASKRISGSHLEIRLVDRGIEVRDLGSTGGTRCAGAGLGGRGWVAVADGALIDVAGVLTLRLRLAAGAGADAGLLIDRPRDRSGLAFLLVPASAGIAFGATGPGPGRDMLALALEDRLWLRPARAEALPWGAGIRFASAVGGIETATFDPADFK